MNLAALAAAATVFDRIEDVARDARCSATQAWAFITQYGFASVSDDGVVTMSETQSWRAARAIDGEWSW